MLCVRDVCHRFLSALELWRDTQRKGVSEFSVLASALEEFAAAKHWENRKKALSDYGVDTSCIDARQLEAEEQAGALLRAETALRSLHEALEVLRNCFISMEQLCSSFTFPEPNGEDTSSNAALIKEKLPACLEMYRTEWQLKSAIVEELNLESPATHALTMAIAWKHQPYIDSSIVKELVAALDSVVSGPAAPTVATGATSSPAAAPASKPKRKKKKKPAAGGAASAADGASAAGDEDAGGDDEA